MDYLHRTHTYLLRHARTGLQRRLMDEIDWNHRIIGIKGSRGVGKTTFLLDYARRHFAPTSPECLYINLNQFSFTTHTLVDFAREFVRSGGRTLLLDQVFKYPNWQEEFKQCYYLYPTLQIVFTASAVMNLEEEDSELATIASVYHLAGFSLREFIHLDNGIVLPTFTLEEIMEHTPEVVREITRSVHPDLWMDRYLEYGYYPFHLEPRLYSENLLKTLNMTLEVDLLFIKQLEQRLLHKLRKLIYLLAQQPPLAMLNVSQLASEIETSRTTVMNYIRYLSEARVLRPVSRVDETDTKKPAMIYLGNPNLHMVLSETEPDRSELLRTFVFNQLSKGHEFRLASRSSVTLFEIDGKYPVQIEAELGGRYRSDRYYILEQGDLCREKTIPVWLFGFLY
nr:AAA family ATPase [uncultured Porphyromonas sp.]